MPAHLFPIFFEGRFAEVDIPLRVKQYIGNNKLYHPACQCVARVYIPNIEYRFAEPEWLVRRAVTREKWQRLVLVLQCHTKTAVSTRKAELSTMTPLDALPRITLSDHVPSNDRRACVVSRTAYEALREIDEGLVHAQRFWETVSASTLNYCVGARGVSVRMRSIQDAAAMAFAFKHVLNLPAPTATHTKALVELHRLIKPDL